MVQTCLVLSGYSTPLPIGVHVRIRYPIDALPAAPSLSCQLPAIHVYRYMAKRRVGRPRPIAVFKYCALCRQGWNSLPRGSSAGHGSFPSSDIGLVVLDFHGAKVVVSWTRHSWRVSCRGNPEFVSCFNSVALNHTEHELESPSGRRREKNVAAWTPPGKRWLGGADHSARVKTESPGRLSHRFLHDEARANKPLVSCGFLHSSTCSMSRLADGHKHKS